MLPFGSITSVVPLVVLGFAYLVYLGTILLNKPDVIEFPGSVEAANIIKADSREDFISAIPDFRLSIDNESDVLITSDTEYQLWEVFLTVIHELPPARPSVLHNVSQFLPRPPPAR